MKAVVHVGSYRPDTPNGVNQILVELCQSLAALGNEVEVWHFQSAVTEPVLDRHGDVTVVRLPFGRLLPGASAMSNLLRWPPPSTRRWLTRRLADVRLLHLHSVFQPENAYLARAGVPHVLTPHGGYGRAGLASRNQRAKGLAWRAFEGRTACSSRFLHAGTVPEAAELAAACPATPIVQIPNGTDRRILDREWAPPVAGAPWLFIGRLAVDHKGLDIMVRGYAQAVRTAGSRIPPLVLAGPDFRGGRAVLERIAEKEGIAGRLSFPGALDAAGKAAALASASAFLHTSRWEGLPLAVLDALGSGRPLLLTPGTNLLDTVSRAGAGVSSGSSAVDVAQAMLTLATADQAVVEGWSAAARSLAVQRYSWEAVALQMSTAYAQHGL